jgi:hypothetical protein
MPDRANGVNHMPCRKAISPGDLGVAGFAAMQATAFIEKLRTGGAMNRPVDATAAEQRAVGGIDDGVDVQRGDVGDDDLEARPRTHSLSAFVQRDMTGTADPVRVDFPSRIA